MRPIRALIGRATVTGGVDHNETHDVSTKVDSEFNLHNKGEQVEKELESSSTASKIRIFH
jgi:hypothetical protein